MAWHLKSGRDYYYRNVRSGDRIRSVYFGRGTAAQQAAAEDERLRQQRAAQRQQLQELRLAIEPVLESLGAFNLAVVDTLQAALVAEGYFLRRREWKVRNVSSTEG